MNTANPEVDEYISEGCGRCDLVGTPDCKVQTWQEEIKALRRLLLECGLTEERKWGSPCYTFNGKNVVMIAAFKDNCSLSFLKGVLLKDNQGILEKPGENSQSVRFARFTDVKQITDQWNILKQYVFEAIEVEKAGLEVKKKDISEHDVPEELQARIDNDLDFKAAFEALTPGRQRSYFIHISQAKQSQTRENRIEKCIPKIRAGKGYNEY
ncbi:YdeI/OmpD-associated family protein [Muricauda sp. CAU 1633]|uniref:YdeI/OmpD-associated family protein n=1 Tax=Allomuricauda sp. CAU 1633 TaxID=2816036 RepID=UPI001A8CBD3C|nr:YdeI/OmpD-associated family protein [Muricauda sp. CAU 1633]MBO0323193.1 YdeI/OmpD-associated family protein [Muricauda sp. CAU 1633]